MDRSAGGERRTRIGYMLSLGNDFDITSVKALSRQGALDPSVAIKFVIPPSGSTGDGGDL
jgi:hypothetical protein